MKKLIIRIAEGLGNQFFMYANGFALSKKINYDLYIDNTSGYFKKKNQFRKYELNNFDISARLIDNNLRYDTYSLDVKRKFKKKIDFFTSRKNFLIESTNKNKKTSYEKFKSLNFSNCLTVEGFFQSEKYFHKYRDDLLKEFKIKNNYVDLNNPLIDMLKNNNSVSICIRQNRFSEGKLIDDKKSKIFTLETINYIKKSVIFFKKKLINPKFFIWSDDFTGIAEHFDQNNYKFIVNNKNKSLNDFYLFQFSKHFIVGPTPFHWWGAWLNQNPNKICLRPSMINPSNNINYWPDSWLSI